MTDNHLKILLEECEDAYFFEDYERLIELCDEILSHDPDCPNAMGYKGVAHCFLNQYGEALKVLERGAGLFPENYYLKNNLAMVYYDLGEFEKSLECCDQGLKIKDFDWLRENRIKALIRLERIEEAEVYWENAGLDIDFKDFLIEAGKYREALSRFSDEGVELWGRFIDKIKRSIRKSGSEIIPELSQYFTDWIYKIRFINDTRICADCGGRLVSIVYGYPTDEDMKMAQKGLIYLGGCQPLPLTHHCRNCGHDFYMGIFGLNIECDSHRLNKYIQFKIRQIVSRLKKDSAIIIRSKENLKARLKGFDDAEFDAFLNHLAEIGFIEDDGEGHVFLSGFDDFDRIKTYPDEGKYAAPRWLVYPELSAWTIGWRMGYGEHYVMFEPPHTNEFKKLFPMPKYWQFGLKNRQYRPYPLLAYFWNLHGKPKYPKASRGIEVTDFMAMDEVGQFRSDTFTFRSIEEAVLVSKYLYFEKCGRDADYETLKKGFELTDEEEERWKTYEYSVILNACYFRVMQDVVLKQKLLETGDEPLICASDDGEDLFARALMELRDEIRRLYENEDLIDWQYTEYIRIMPW